MKQYNVAKIFKALSNDQRLKLFKLIYDHQSGNCSNNNYVEGLDKAFTIACNHLNVSRPTVSHHLKELVNSGLVFMTRSGQSFRCEINIDALNAIRKFLQ